MRIDFHCHIFQELNSINSLVSHFQNFLGYGFYERIKNGIRKIEKGNFNDIIEKCLFYINRNNIDKVILLPLSLKENKLVLEWQKRAPDIFVPFYNPPEGKLTIKELKNEITTSVTQREYKGFKITSTFRQKFLNDKTLMDIFEIAYNYGLVVLFHAGYPPPGTKKNVLTYSNPLYIEEIIQSFPKLNIVIAHMGYPWVDIALSLAVQYTNVYLDISNLIYMMPNRLKEFLLRAKELIGLDKILFGSDGFIPEMIEMSVHMFENANYLIKMELNKIMGLNAQKLLGL
jgi:uncharacterized protein